MRIFELAKELGVPSKDMVAKLRDLGVEVKGHMSGIDDTAVELMREAFGKPAPAAAAPKPAAAAPAAEPKITVHAAPQPEEPAAVAPPALPTEEEEEFDEVQWEQKLRDEAHERSREKAPRKDGPFRHPPREADVELPKQKPEAKGPEAGGPETTLEGKIIRVKGPVPVKELAERLGLRPNRLIADLMGMNVFASILERVDINVARKVAEKYGFEVEHEKRAEHKPVVRKADVEQAEAPEDPADLVSRPPVVTFLGHVDHGKTSLLDAIRNTSVASGEWGGITQHIGAYSVSVRGRSITFLDTPGHAAFTAMRARGANLTDIAVIIVAADDGIMPQTKEAIQHAKAANVTMMVAINKIDLPAAAPERVKQQLQGEGLTPEDWGGETICCPVSAITKQGIENLLEMILLQADLLDLKSNPKRRATGFVVEASLQPGMGPTANLLVTNGTLHVGDVVLCGRHFGKVRALMNDHGVKVLAAGASTPVRCLGLSGVPEAGAQFQVYENERVARQLAEVSTRDARSEQLTMPKKASLDTLFAQIEEGKKVELRVVLKTDAQGSLEAIVHALEDIKSTKVSLSVLLGAIGNITVNDVMLASASNAVILGFHVGKEPGVDAASRHEGVEIRLHQIIYELLDQVRSAMAGLLAPILRERVTGHAEILQVFPLGKIARVAGCMVRDGNILPRYKVRVKRKDEVLFEGQILTLKRFKDTVNEVREGQDCGIRLDGFNAIEAADILEFYEIQEIEQSL